MEEFDEIFFNKYLSVWLQFGFTRKL